VGVNLKQIVYDVSIIKKGVMKMDKVKVTELGKGTRVILRNGWVATLMDGYKKRSTRLAREEGLLNEIRLIYVSDIGYAEIDEQLYEVEVPENMVSNWSGR